MQIQLRQTEIVEALKQYITKQGISLVGKTVEIGFTAGRKETGISADISIDEGTQAQLPGLDADEDEAAPARPMLSVVTDPQVTSSVETVEEPAPPADEAPKAVAAASLFS